MNDDLLNILSGGSSDPDQRQLLDYLNNRLSEKDKYEFEKNMAGSDLLREAVEGLEKFGDRKEVAALVEQLNHQLRAQLEKKKARKLKRELKNPAWVYVAIVLLLVLVMVAFLVIRRYTANREPPPLPRTSRSASAH